MKKPVTNAEFWALLEAIAKIVENAKDVHEAAKLIRELKNER